MTQIPTTQEVQQLGARLAMDGFEAHETEIRDLAQLAVTIDPESVTPAVLADRSAPKNVRSRAFSKLAADWEQLSPDLQERADRFDRSLGQLLEAWNAHENLRSSGAPIAELVASRTRLGERRTYSTQMRRGLPGTSLAEPAYC